GLGMIPMHPMTAICFILAGLSLWLQGETNPPARGIARTCALPMLLTGLLKLSVYIWGRPYRFDQWLFMGSVAAGHFTPIAAATALNLLLLGTALFLDPRRPAGRRFGQPLTLIAIFISLLSVLGYLYGSQSFYTLLGSSPTALPTALTFIVLGSGILSLQWDRGAMKYLTDDGPAGFMARRLLPWCFLVPGRLGWLRLLGERRGLYCMEYGTVLSVIMSIVVLTSLTWFMARLLYRIDAGRKKLEAERERYARFYSMSLDMFSIAGFDGYFKDLSPTWDSVLGYTIREL